MKIFRIIQVCFTFAFLGIWLYFDIRFEPQSLYWLIFKLTGFFLIFASAIFVKIKQKTDSKGALIFFICWAVFFVGLTSRREIKTYREKACENMFGKEFNMMRQKLGVPEIPAGWITTNGYRFSSATKGKNDIIGHKRKFIEIEDCTLKSEDDLYVLKAVGTIKRSLSIETRYAQGKGKDSIFYSYEVGDSTRIISRQQADSIFNAEKIRKDY